MRLFGKSNKCPFKARCPTEEICSHVADSSYQDCSLYEDWSGGGVNENNSCSYKDECPDYPFSCLYGNDPDMCFRHRRHKANENSYYDSEDDDDDGEVSAEDQAKIDSLMNNIFGESSSSNSNGANRVNNSQQNTTTCQFSSKCNTAYEDGTCLFKEYQKCLDYQDFLREAYGTCPHKSACPKSPNLCPFTDDDFNICSKYKQFEFGNNVTSHSKQNSHLKENQEDGNNVDEEKSQVSKESMQDVAIKCIKSNFSKFFGDEANEARNKKNEELMKKGEEFTQKLTSKFSKWLKK